MVSDIFLYIPIYITNVNVFEEINMGGFKKYIKYMALMFILINSFPEKILDFCPLVSFYILWTSPAYIKEDLNPREHEQTT